jgi:hypothetical protein
MKRLIISLGLLGVVIIVANLTFAQDAPSASTNTQTNSVNSASSSGSGW